MVLEEALCEQVRLRLILRYNAVVANTRVEMRKCKRQRPCATRAMRTIATSNSRHSAEFGATHPFATRTQTCRLESPAARTVATIVDSSVVGSPVILLLVRATPNQPTTNTQHRIANVDCTELYRPLRIAIAPHISQLIPDVYLKLFFFSVCFESD